MIDLRQAGEWALPQRIGVTVTLGGDRLAGAFVEVALPMWRKTPYHLLLGPADEHGVIERSQAELLDQIHIVQHTGLMDYSGPADWTGAMIVTALDREDAKRAVDGYGVWGEAVPDAYPPGFPRLMEALAERLERAAGASLAVTVTFEPSSGIEVHTRSRRA